MVHIRKMSIVQKCQKKYNRKEAFDAADMTIPGNIAINIVFRAFQKSGLI